MILEMTKVESSQIDAMGHDPVSNVLRVAFNNGSVYTYQNVTGSLFEALLAADSVGKAFHSSIKVFPVQFPFSKEV